MIIKKETADNIRVAAERMAKVAEGIEHGSKNQSWVDFVKTKFAIRGLRSMNTSIQGATVMTKGMP